MSPKVQELQAIARHYCELVESLQDGNTQWLEQVASLLPRLHVAVSALNLPKPNTSHHTVADLDARFLQQARHEVGSHVAAGTEHQHASGQQGCRQVAHGSAGSKAVSL